MKDILLDDNYDLLTANHDFAVGDADAQIASVILEAATGEFKEAPLLGADARRMIGGTPDPFWSGRVKSMLKGQHLNVKDITITDNDINIELK